jgi:putative spermidine/putrescine transport system permease protein
MEARRSLGFLLITPLGLVLLAVFVAPIVLMLPTSFRHYGENGAATTGWTFENYTQIATDPYFHDVLGRTLTMGALVTLVCLVVGYPLAYVLARSTGAARSLLTVLVVFPLLLNLVVRSFGWMALLANHGLLNNLLITLHVIDQPLHLMFNLTGLIIGLTHIYLPFMVLVLVAALQAMPRDVEAASAMLGSGPIKTFFLVTLPLTAPGLFAGSVLVFVLTISALVTPRLLGGPAYKVMATVIYDEFLSDLDWPSGAALAFVLTLIALLIVAGAGLVTRRWTGAQ